MREIKKLFILAIAIVASSVAFAQEFTPSYHESSDSDLQGRFKVALDIPSSLYMSFVLNTPELLE